MASRLAVKIVNGVFKWVRETIPVTDRIARKELAQIVDRELRAVKKK